MKVCPHCGRQNAIDYDHCAGCQSLLAVEEPAPKPGRIGSRSSILLSSGFFDSEAPVNLSAIGMGYSVVEGFSHPDWKLIGSDIKRNFAQEFWAQVWREIGINWLAHLREDLGGNYRQYESWNFLLLSAETTEDTEAILKMAEEAEEILESNFLYLMRRGLYGKRVILAFSEQDDYYSYISNFHSEGKHASSGGVFLSRGYAHIAFPFIGISYVKDTLVHELPHNWLWRLKIPTWLNEGLSQKMERVAGANSNRQQTRIVDADLAGEHHDYWDKNNIQAFWAGTSFYSPDKGNKLSYSLGEILIELLLENKKDFVNFIEHADPRDGGQDAALKFLGRCLGEAAGVFLGPGEWRPNRKQIASLWEQKYEKPKEQ